MVNPNVSAKHRLGGGLSRIVQNMDVLREAPMDGFTAFLATAGMQELE